MLKQSILQPTYQGARDSRATNSKLDKWPRPEVITNMSEHNFKLYLINALSFPGGKKAVYGFEWLGRCSKNIEDKSDLILSLWHLNNVKYIMIEIINYTTISINIAE